MQTELIGKICIIRYYSKNVRSFSLINVSITSTLVCSLVFVLIFEYCTESLGKSYIYFLLFSLSLTVY